MAENLRLVVEANGDVAAVYDDALVPTLSALGPSVVTRASHVEPTEGGWIADMGPVGGPVLFANGSSTQEFVALTARRPELAVAQILAHGFPLRPFETRAEALAAERLWLREHLGL